MDAVEFLRARRKLCDDNVCGESCPLFDCCDDDLEDDRVRQVLAVEQLAKEHPAKTRQSEFLKMFPNARIESDGMPSICPIVVDKRCHNKDDDALFCLVRDEEECGKCRHDFWLAEISEEKTCE